MKSANLGQLAKALAVAIELGADPSSELCIEVNLGEYLIHVEGFDYYPDKKIFTLYDGPHYQGCKPIVDES